MNEGLRLGMFWGGLIMAAVPVSLGVGIAIYVLKKHLKRGGSTADGGASGPAAYLDSGRKS